MLHADRFRLNASHLTPAELSSWLDRLESLYSETGKILPVVVDLQGAKMRIGQYPSVERVPGKVSIFSGSVSNDPAFIPVPGKELFMEVKAGEQLTLNDRKVVVEVTDVGEGRLGAVVVQNGPLSSRKGINRPEHPIPYHRITDRDREMMLTADPCPFVQFAFSFIHDGQEVVLLRDLTDRCLIAKVERPEAMLYLDSIREHFDEIWFCRGDMGAQAGLGRLGKLQMEMAAAIPALNCPVVLAGQLLQHMSVSPEPTRSEVVGLHRAARDGFMGIVLSDETAVGDYPVEAALAAREYFH